MGRLNFRVSYSQNVRRHSIEVAYLTGLLGEQLGLDGALARQCGFLHDIGKAADHEMEGGHPAVGAELLKRYGEPPEVVHAALGHHDDIRVDHIYTVLVAAADAISAARPGARQPHIGKVRLLEARESQASGSSSSSHLAYFSNVSRQAERRPKSHPPRRRVPYRCDRRGCRRGAPKRRGRPRTARRTA